MKKIRRLFFIQTDKNTHPESIEMLKILNIHYQRAVSIGIVVKRCAKDYQMGQQNRQQSSRLLEESEISAEDVWEGCFHIG